MNVTMQYNEIIMANAKNIIPAVAWVMPANRYFFVSIRGKILNI